MSQNREPPKDLWWTCHACGRGNGPYNRTSCGGCGKAKYIASDRSTWDEYQAMTSKEDPDGPR